MMNFGYYVNGGSSSSSSNLSPLAPPFTVERSFPKPNSSPVVDFIDHPPYAVPMISSFQNWVPSHYPNSTPDFFPNPNPEVDSVPSSDAYRYSPNTQLPPLNPVANAATSGFVFGQCSDGVPHSVVQTEPYHFPTYVAPAPAMAIYDDNALEVPERLGYDLLSTSHVGTLNISSHSDYTQSLSGLEYAPQWGGWKELADWQQGKQVELDGNFCSTENVAGSSIFRNYMDQAIHASNGLSSSEESTAVLHSINMLGREKCTGSVSTDHPNDTSFSEKNSEFIPVDCPRTLILGSTSALLENHAQVPSIKLVTNSRSNQMPFSASHERNLSQDYLSLDDNTSTIKCSPMHSITLPAVGPSSSAPNADSFKNVNIGSDAAYIDFSGNDPSGTKGPHPPVNSVFKDLFNTSQLSNHLERNDLSFMEPSSTKNKELSNNKHFSKDALDSLFLKSKSGRQVPHTSSDGISLALDNGGVSHSAENSSKSLDHYNPAVDSPCWKGAPVSKVYPFETSEAVTSQLMKKQDACNVLNLQGPEFFPLGNDDSVKVSFQKQSEKMYYENGCLDICLAPSLMRSSIVNCYSGEHLSDDGVNGAAYLPKPNRGSAVPFSNDIHEPREGYTLHNRSKGDSVIEPSQSMQKSLEEKHESGTGVEEIGMNISDASEANSSYVPFHAAEHVLCSPSSVEDATTKYSKSRGGESTPKIDVQMLVNTMHNLSELLLFYCSNDSCGLKEQYCVALKNVIINLDTCISKNIEKRTATLESLVSRQGGSKFLGEFLELQKGVHVDSPVGTNLAAVGVQDKLGHQDVHKGKKQHVVSGENDDKISEVVFQRGGADFAKDGNMTQAIKNVLSENFNSEGETQLATLMYKNLWLEAEAALCSINYRARYNRMKIEMDKAKDVSKNTADVEKLSRSEIFSDLNAFYNVAPETKGGLTLDTSIQDSPNISTSSHADDVLVKFHILKSRVDDSKSEKTDLEELSRSNVSHYMSEVDKLITETKNGLAPDIFVQDFPISCENSLSNDVMGRFHILKSWDENSDSLNIMGVEELSSSKVSQVLKEVDKLVTGANDSPCPDVFVQYSPVSSKKGHADDVEASVMARLHILRNRIDNSSSMNVEGQPIPKVERPGFGEKRNNWHGSEIKNLDKILGPDLQHQPANCNDNNWIVKELHHSVKDDQSHTHRTNTFGNQLHTVLHGSSSSDWEYVLKDEFIE